MLAAHADDGRHHDVFHRPIGEMMMRTIFKARTAGLCRPRDVTKKKQRNVAGKVVSRLAKRGLLPLLQRSSRSMIRNLKFRKSCKTPEGSGFWS